MELGEGISEVHVVYLNVCRVYSKPSYTSYSVVHIAHRIPPHTVKHTKEALDAFTINWLHHSSIYYKFTNYTTLVNHEDNIGLDGNGGITDTLLAKLILRPGTTRTSSLNGAETGFPGNIQLAGTSHDVAFQAEHSKYSIVTLLLYRPTTYVYTAISAF